MPFKLMSHDISYNHTNFNRYCKFAQGLGILKQKFPNTPVLALTATATASVKEDVVQALGLANCVIFQQSFNRPNLWCVEQRPTSY